MKLFSDEYLARYDKGRVLETVGSIPDQARHAWGDASRVRIPASYNKARHIVIAGMGGSLLGPHIFKEVYSDRALVPITLINGYDLPKSVDQNTLLVLSSYSGTTEEVLSCERQALKKTRMVMGISLGGPLLQRLAAHKLPYYKIEEKYNPSGQPRMGVAYSTFGQLALLRHLLGAKAAEVEDAVAHAARVQKTWMTTAKGIARIKKIVRMLHEKAPIIAGAEFLAGPAHVAANQWNENAKTFATYFVLPELNHHLLEGLTFPRSVVKKTVFLFLSSSLLHLRNQKRIAITKRVIEQQGIRTDEVRMTGKTKLSVALEAILFSSLLTTAYALTYHIDPVQIPWVNYLKSHLAK